MTLILHQMVTISKDRKAKAISESTTLEKVFREHRGIYDGFVQASRATVDGVILDPDQSKRPQRTVPNDLTLLTQMLIDSNDAQLTQDVGNLVAKANLTLKFGDEELVLEGLPATHLLFLEHQAKALIGIIQSMPILDDATEWDKFDANKGLWVSKPEEKSKTQKKVKTEVVVPPTDKFPAQVREYSVDEKIGVISTTKMSGAVPRATKELLLCKAQAFYEAVRQARADANTVKIDQKKEGEKILKWMFGDLVDWNKIRS